MPKDLAIVMRVYPLFSKNILSDLLKIKNFSKLKLFHISLLSLLNSLNNIDYRIHFILDTCPKEYKEIISKEIDNKDLGKVIEVNNAGNRNTFHLQLSLMKDERDVDIFFIAEDDYLYLASLKPIIDFIISRNDVDFITPYDHPDYYTSIHDYINNSEKVLTYGFGNYKFRTVASTTLTFFAKSSSFKYAFNNFLLYVNSQLMDHEVWLTITKMKHKSVSFKRTLYFWLRAFPYLLSHKSMKLFAPYPTLAIHLAKDGIPKYLKNSDIMSIMEKYL